MGILTNDMARLRREIGVMRGARKSLMKDLARGTREMKADVAVMQAGFRDAHAEMAGNMKAVRAAFVSSLKSAVSGMRREFADDLAGARQAWFGMIPAVSMAMAPAERKMEEFGADLGMEEEEIEAQPVEAAGQEIEAHSPKEETERTEAGTGDEEVMEQWTVPLKPRPKGKKKKF